MTDELDQRDGFEYEERRRSLHSWPRMSMIVVDKLTGANEPPPRKSYSLLHVDDD